jgi:hypothetical protein
MMDEYSHVYEQRDNIELSEHHLEHQVPLTCAIEGNVRDHCYKGAYAWRKSGLPYDYGELCENLGRMLDQDRSQLKT